MPDKHLYTGRFAPSPTGPLHLGSLYTALASFLDAKAHHGKWLLRIDDLDSPRNVAGSADSILKTLDTFALHWDDCIYFQSAHLQIYQNALQHLQHNNLIYPCLCSRKTLSRYTTALAGTEAIYPNNCRDNRLPCYLPYALRLKTNNCLISFQDRLQGKINHLFTDQQGDFILKRKDHIVAYQFAVVIDDNQQGITHVVRGIDLLDLTPRQIYLQQLLGLPTPIYMHTPIIVDTTGFKLSKQTGAQAVNLTQPSQVMFQLLHLLKQHPPAALKKASPAELISWAIAHWNTTQLNKIHSIPLSV